MTMYQVGSKNHVRVVSDEDFSELLEKTLNIRLRFIGGEAVVPATKIT
jgi:hypothetical protein